MKKKLVIIGLVMVMCLGVLSGCEDEKPIPYNAKLFISGMVYELIPGGFFTDSFWENNMTLGASYKNENWDPEDPLSKEYLFDKTSPKERLYIVTDQNTYDSIFCDYRQVDFDNSMIIVYLRTTIASGIPNLANVKFENEVLTIEVTYKNANAAYAPHREFMAIQMDRIEFESIKFNDV